MSKSGLYFYSEKCKNCQKMKSAIAPFANELQMCCIDYQNVRRTLPAVVTAVPSLILAGEPKPVVGDDIYHWIQAQEAKSRRGGGGRAQPMGQGGAGSADEPSAVCMEWSSAYSDNYSFIGDEKPQAHAFSFLDGSAPDERTNSPPVVVPERKRDDNEVTSRMERFMAQRDREVAAQNGPVFIP